MAPEIDMTLYENMGFYADQMNQIRHGLSENLNVRHYADTEFNAAQMKQIRLGLQSGVDPTIYCDAAYDSDQMQELRWGLETGLDVLLYANPRLDGMQMNQIRQGLQANIDVSIYADPKFHWLQMNQIYMGLKAGIDPTLYADPKIDSDQMNEIRLDLEQSIKDPEQRRELTRDEAIEKMVAAGFNDEQIAEELETRDFARELLKEHAEKEPQRNNMRDITIISDKISQYGNIPFIFTNVPKNFSIRDFDYESAIKDAHNVMHGRYYEGIKVDLSDIDNPQVDIRGSVSDFEEAKFESLTIPQDKWESLRVALETNNIPVIESTFVSDECADTLLTVQSIHVDAIHQLLDPKPQEAIFKDEYGYRIKGHEGMVFANDGAAKTYATEKLGIDIQSEERKFEKSSKKQPKEPTPNDDMKIAKAVLAAKAIGAATKAVSKTGPVI